MLIKKQQFELDMEQESGSQLAKEYVKGCVLSLCLFNLYAKDMMRNASLEESWAGIKNAKTNINNLSYADDTTLMTGEEELKSLLMRVKE